MNRTQHNRNLGAQRDCSGWRVRAHAGFTLVEQLVIIAIMVLVSIVMVRGVPAAYSAFNNAVDAANAQLLLSTAATRLRDELSVADPTPQDPTRAPKGTTGNSNTLAQFDSMETGFLVKLEKGDDGSVTIKRQAVDPSVFGAAVSDANATSDPLIATKADAGARSKELQVKVDSIEYEGGVFTVKNLHVVRKGSDDTLAGAKIDELKVRVLGNLS